MWPRRRDLPIGAHDEMPIGRTRNPLPRCRAAALPVSRSAGKPGEARPQSAGNGGGQETFSALSSTRKLVSCPVRVSFPVNFSVIFWPM
jgi:hypothetical protein